MSISIVTENTLRDMLSVRDTELVHANKRIEFLKARLEKVEKDYRQFKNNISFAEGWRFK